nr:hypothetical protein BSM_21030 [uncultured archaeon]
MVLKSKLGIILSKIFLGYEILEILITTDAQHSTYPSCNNLLQRIAGIVSYPYKTAKSQIIYFTFDEARHYDSLFFISLINSKSSFGIVLIALPMRCPLHFFLFVMNFSFGISGFKNHRFLKYLHLFNFDP